METTRANNIANNSNGNNTVFSLKIDNGKKAVQKKTTIITIQKSVIIFPIILLMDGRPSGEDSESTTVDFHVRARFYALQQVTPIIC